MVPFIEEQVQRALDGREARREVGSVRDIEQPLGARQDLLGPRESFLHRRVRTDERARDFVDTESAEDMQDERDLRFLREAGMAAGEHHAQLVILDCVGGKALLDRRRERPLAIEERPSSGAKRRAVRSRRRTSSARRLAVAMSHAEGFSGTPRSFQTSSARQKASCTTSSASARLWTPKILVSVATKRPASRRNRWSLSSFTCSLS